MREHRRKEGGVTAEGAEPSAVHVMSLREYLSGRWHENEPIGVERCDSVPGTGRFPVDEPD